MSAKWIDITELIRNAASELEEGQFIASPDFSYEAAMRSIDIDDPKIDSGMEAMTIEPIPYLIKQGKCNFAKYEM